jgi:hypothetical protein
MWLFKSNVGVFKIACQPDGRYGLYVDDNLLDVYYGPESAADDVMMRYTGYGPWDNQPVITGPFGLRAWEKVE